VEEDLFEASLFLDLSDLSLKAVGMLFGVGMIFPLLKSLPKLEMDKPLLSLNPWTELCTSVVIGSTVLFTMD
jgi:hypothetical protein